MQVWKGWMATSAAAAVPGANTAPTGEEWCARQRRLLGSEQHQHLCQHESTPFSDWELARLSFVRWLYQIRH